MGLLARSRQPLSDRVTTWAVGWTKAFGALAALATTVGTFLAVLSQGGDAGPLIQDILTVLRGLR